MSTTVFYSLSIVCQYLTLYHLLVLCHCDHCCLPPSVHCLQEPHIVTSVGSGSLYQLMSSTVYPLSVSTSHCTSVGSVSLCPLPSFTVCPLSVRSSHCQYHLLVLCQCVHYCLLKSVLCPSVPHSVSTIC